MVYQQSANMLKTFPSMGYAAYISQRQQQRQRNGYSYTKTTTKRKRPSYSSVQSFKKAVKQTESARHYTGTNPLGLTQGTGLTLIPTTGIVQSNANNGRTGDSVTLCALKVRGFFNTAASSGAYFYRILVGYTGEEYNIPSTFSSAGLTATEVFLSNTASGFSALGIINPKAFTLLHDEIVTINSSIAASLDGQTYEFTVGLNNTTFNYQADASVQGKTRNLAIYIVGGVAGGTNGVTSAGGTTISWDLVYKD